MDAAPRQRQLTLVLLAAEAGSVIYALVELLYAQLLPTFLSKNAIAGQARVALSVATGGAALLAVLFGWWRTRAPGDPAAQRLSRRARSAAPLLLVWAIPGLMSQDAFRGRELDLLLMTGLAVIALEGAFTMRQRTRPESDETDRAAWLPAACVGLMVVSYVTLASWGSIRLHEKLYTSLFDLGMFENLFWNALHGVQGISADRLYFGQHAPLILYVLLPFYALWPHAETLLVIQSALLGTAAIPLYLLARKCLQNAWQAVILVAAFLFYPALHGPNFYDFHFLTLSTFFVLWAACFFVFEKWWAFWLALLLALCCREDVSIGVAVVGLGLAWSGIRPRVGLAAFAVAAVWFVLVKLVWMHRIAAGDTFIRYYAGLVAPGQRGFVGVLVTLISNPLYVLPRMLTRRKLLLALHLLVPLAFLPLRRKKTAFLLLPGLLVVGLTTGARAVVQIHFQYVAHFVPYVFVAAVAALAPLGAARRRAVLAAVVLGTAVATFHFGAAFQERYKVSFHEVNFGWSPRDAQRLNNLNQLIARIPPQANVAASDPEGAHVARRRHLHGIKEGVKNADYILYGLAGLRWGGKPQIARALQSGRYGVVARRGQFALLERGASTARNRAELRRLFERR